MHVSTGGLCPRRSRTHGDGGGVEQRLVERGETPRSPALADRIRDGRGALGRVLVRYAGHGEMWLECKSAGVEPEIPFRGSPPRPQSRSTLELAPTPAPTPHLKSSCQLDTCGSWLSRESRRPLRSSTVSGSTCARAGICSQLACRLVRQRARSPPHGEVRPLISSCCGPH